MPWTSPVNEGHESAQVGLVDLLQGFAVANHLAWFGLKHNPRNCQALCCGGVACEGCSLQRCADWPKNLGIASGVG